MIRPFWRAHTTTLTGECWPLLRAQSEMAAGGAGGAPALGKEEEGQLRGMILSMVDEPLVLVVKLADRCSFPASVHAWRPLLATVGSYCCPSGGCIAPAGEGEVHHS